MMCRPIEGGPKAKRTLLLRCNGTKPSEVQRQHQGRDISTRQKTLLLRCNGIKPSEVQRQHQGRDISTRHTSCNGKVSP
ncbi:hypothetical protein LEMLEM_LOCUS1702 [Lemmus lemmus]